MPKLSSFLSIIFSIVILSTIQKVNTIDWSPVDDIVNGYLNNAAFPGAVLRVANKTHTLYSKQYGKVKRQTGQAGAASMNSSTIFDIASLSKVTGTLGVIMTLVDIGLISIQDKVIQYIPEFNNNGKQQIIIQNLLLHNAGLLPDFVGDFSTATKQQIMQFIYNCKLQSPIGTKYVYSDLSFILLGEISQRVLSQKLNQSVKINLENMGILNTGYLPDSKLLYRIAPTQYSKIRNKLIWGQVHDPTSYIFGGVAGHAGLFSVADDLVSYMQVHLNKGLTKSGKRVYNQSTVQKFYTRVDGLSYDNKRALGWDTVPNQTNPPCGHKFSQKSFGHTGYTGTMMWADVQKQLIVVFLTNRVHPTSLQSSQIITARADICDKVVDILF